VLVALVRKTKRSLAKVNKQTWEESCKFGIRKPPLAVAQKARLGSRRGGIIVLQKDIEKAKGQMLCEAVQGLLKE
jgi:hypothetical protein